MPVYHDRPEMNVTFFTERGELVARYSQTTKPIYNDIVSIQTVREMGADSPAFTINLVGGIHWHKFLAPNDLLMVTMQRPPQAPEVVMVGLIEDIRKKVTMSESNPSRVTTVTGRGVAKAFMFDIGVVPEASIHDSNVGWVLAHGVTMAGTRPTEILQQVWDNIAKKIVNFKWGDKTLFDIIDLKRSDKDNLLLMEEASLVNYQGTLLAFMQEMIETPWYELFWEVEKGRPALICRPTPFNSAEWSQLPIIDITDDDVNVEDIGRSDLETYTLYSVGVKILNSLDNAPNLLGLPPLTYDPYYDKYGIRRLHLETAYLATVGSEDLSSYEVIRSLMIDLYNWNILNNSMYNGTLVVKGHQKYKVGQRLRYTSVENNNVMEYYITSVAHEFICYQGWSTTLGIVRGTPEGTRFRSPVGDYKEFSGAVVGMSNGSRPLTGVPEYPMMTGSTGATTIVTGDNAKGLSTEGLSKAEAVVAGATHILNYGVNGRKLSYVFGSTSIENKGTTDCSALIQYIFKKYAGMDIGRSTSVQVNKGTKISSSAFLIPGDLVMYCGTHKGVGPNQVSHVGVYVGNGEVIHIGGSPGVQKVGVHKITNAYTKKSAFMCGRRVLPQEGK